MNFSICKLLTPRLCKYIYIYIYIYIKAITGHLIIILSFSEYTEPVERKSKFNVARFLLEVGVHFFLVIIQFC